MQYSIIRNALLVFFGTALCSIQAFAKDPHYTSPADNIKNFFSGTWEGSFNLGYAIPQSSAQLDNAIDCNLGVYHDIGSNMAVEFQYLSIADLDLDLDSNASLGSSASFKSSAYIGSLRGYGKPGPFDLTYFGRLGVAIFSVDFDNGARNQNDYDSGQTLLFGFGAEKKVAEKTTVTVEATYYHSMVQDGYLTTFNIGIRQALLSW